MHLRYKITLLLVLLALTAPQFAHADTMGWEFTLSNIRFTSPDTYVLVETQTFFISRWETPMVVENGEIIGYNLYFAGVETTLDGIPRLDAGIHFYPDGAGVNIPNGAFTYNYKTSNLWTGDPYHPQFIVQDYIGDAVIGLAAVDIVAVNAPEPSTIALFGTGCLSMLGVFRLKRK